MDKKMIAQELVAVAKELYAADLNKAYAGLNKSRSEVEKLRMSLKIVLRDTKDQKKLVDEVGDILSSIEDVEKRIGKLMSGMEK